MMWRRRERAKDAPHRRRCELDVRMFTVGPVAENCFIVRRERLRSRTDRRSRRRGRADPRAGRRSSALTVEAILAHPLPLRPHRRGRPGRRGHRARPSTAPRSRCRCWPTSCPSSPGPASGPFESYDADETVAGGEKLELAGLEIDVIFTPGHSPGHVTYSVRDEAAHLLRGRPLPGLGRPRRPPRGRLGDAAGVDPRAGRSHPRDDRCIPGHMGITTLGAERATNPFLAELALSRPAGNKIARMASRFQAPRGTFDVLPAERGRPARVGRTARGDLSSGPATSGSRPRPSRRPSCSRAASAARPTSSRRRCSPSRTRAGAASPCDPRAPRRSAAPTSSTACRSWPSR